MCPEVVELVGQPFTPYKGSVVVPCPECGKPMWLPPESKKKHEEFGWPIFCMVCVVKTHPAEGDRMISLTNKMPGE